MEYNENIIDFETLSANPLKNEMEVLVIHTLCPLAVTLVVFGEFMNDNYRYTLLIYRHLRAQIFIFRAQNLQGNLVYSLMQL